MTRLPRFLPIAFPLLVVACAVDSAGSGASPAPPTMGEDDDGAGEVPEGTSADTTGADEEAVSMDASRSADGLSTTAPVAATSGLTVDFERHAVGVYTAAMLEADWGPSARIEQGIAEGRAKIVDIAGNKKLEITFPANRANVGAAVQFKVPIAPRADYNFEYRAKFNPGFEWMLGGKMPGLVGGSAPTGCVSDTNGMSARYMWQANGGARLYLYYASKPASLPCGDGIAWSPLHDFAPSGEWHTLRQHIRLNTTFAPANGIVEIWFDGKPVLRRTNVLFRKNASAKWSIDGIYFSTFFGGPDKTAYRPKKAVRVLYDDFRIW